MSRKFFFIVLLSISTTIFSQDKWSPEKVYLQLTSKVYATDETIWFKAIVTEAISHFPTDISGVLHVDLIHPNGKIVSRKLVKLVQGTGQGSFDPDKSFTDGRYLIRAYTQWNRNFGNDFTFERHIDLVDPFLLNDTKLIDSLKLKEVRTGQFLLRGKIRSKAIETLSDKQVQVVINREKGSDTLYVRRNGRDAYTFEYEVPEGLGWVTLAVNGLSETIILKQNEADLQFFPESGTLVQGVTNRIAYKATGIDGKGKKSKDLFSMTKSNILPILLATTWEWVFFQ